MLWGGGGSGGGGGMLTFVQLATPLMGWVGWGGDVKVAHMVDATQLRLCCLWTRAGCYASDGVAGVGRGC